STIVGEENFLEWGWRIPFFIALPLGIIGLYLRHALEETPAFQWFQRQNKALPVTDKYSDYQPGDIVSWRLDNGLAHIGVVSLNV
ncbi:DUF1287 domain-containing protein, partial [Salmonella enterica subsp. enterica serovar Kentucky]|nr:DUF1287 domain-containing protein [Salmonella enterica subsp. enterica serovar Kentucky]